MTTWPPSLPQENLTKSHTHHEFAQGVIGEPCILGVDEAGRGPVLGPMVYAVAYCPISYKNALKEVGFADSKVISADFRESLLRRMGTDPELQEKLGWATTILTARDIAAGMLRPGMAYNLNDQAHDCTINLIQLVLNSGVQLAEIYVDTVGPPDKYQAKLSARFPGIKFVVTKKADSLYPIVSCASICAKVSRDISLKTQLENCGSGYPADPATVAWLRGNIDKLFGWGPLVRYSWSTARDMLDKALSVEWQVNNSQAPQCEELPRIGLEWFTEY